MFEGFRLETIQLPEATLRVRHGGAGPPVLLLHGHRGRMPHGTVSPRLSPKTIRWLVLIPEALAAEVLAFLSST